jgi:hypothetical protein
MDMTYEEYIDYINSLFIQRMCDAEYLEFILHSNLGEV